MGHREDQVRSLPILKLEQLLDVNSPGFRPEIRRLEDRHQHLLSANSVHLLPNDRLNLRVNPPAGREKGPEARPQLPDHSCPYEQFVTGRLGVCRTLPEGRDKGFREPGHPA